MAKACVLYTIMELKPFSSQQAHTISYMHCASMISKLCNK